MGQFGSMSSLLECVQKGCSCGIVSCRYIEMDKITGVSEVPQAQQDQNHATFQVLCAGRIILFQAQNEAEMKKWVMNLWISFWQLFSCETCRIFCVGSIIILLSHPDGLLLWKSCPRCQVEHHHDNRNNNNCIPMTLILVVMCNR